jgi:2-dehydrotetronate isomerase
MLKFAANLSFMYNEHEFLDRFAGAARDGFKGIEFLFPYEHPAGEIRNRLDEHGLTQALFNAPPGNWAAGERGIASLPGRQEEFRRTIATALDYVQIIGNKTLHVMAGLTVGGVDRARQRAVYVNNLAHAADQAAGLGVTIVIEPINTRDIPGFFLNRQDEAQAICAEIGKPNLKVQFDLYHCQIVEGDLAMRLRRDMPTVGHIQIAGVPERHEPDTGEVNYGYLLSLIEDLGYSGWIGCEYRPAAATSAGLGWFAPWRDRN